MLSACPPPPAPSTQVMDVHFLMTVAVAGAIALADYVEAGSVVVLFAVAEHWERRSADKARASVAAVLTLRPESGEQPGAGAGSGAVGSCVGRAASGCTAMQRQAGAGRGWLCHSAGIRWARCMSATWPSWV